GMVDTSGTATPLLTLTPVAGKPVLEGKLSRSGISVLGMDVPLETLVDPIEIPSAISEEVDLGERTATTEFRATEVIPEEGHVRVKGVMTVTPKASKK
ncbi:MAG TPA: hypothetical protein VMV18_07300, partial [bacterium]|nr:hypothetical protein [bacterium]